MPVKTDVMPSFFYYELLAKYKELEAVAEDKIKNARQLHAEAVGRNAKLLRENADLRSEIGRLRETIKEDFEDEVEYRKSVRKLETKLAEITRIVCSR